VLGAVILTISVWLLIAAIPLKSQEMAAQTIDLLGFRRRPLIWLGVALLLVLIGAAAFLKGDRGVLTGDGEPVPFVRIHRIPPGSSERLEGLLDLAPHGDYHFYGR